MAITLTRLPEQFGKGGVDVNEGAITLADFLTEHINAIEELSAQIDAFSSVDTRLTADEAFFNETDYQLRNVTNARVSTLEDEQVAQAQGLAGVSNLVFGMGASLNVATLADLTSLFVDNATIYSNNTVAHVESLDAYFYLRLGASYTVDGITVVSAGPPGIGQWIRAQTRSLKWEARTLWYVDAQNVAANDENDGGSSGSPLKTVQELAQRLHSAQLGSVVPVYVLSDCLSTDKAVFTYRSLPGVVGQLNFVGVPIVVRSSTMTAGTANASASPYTDFYKVEDTALGATTWDSTGYVAKTTSTNGYLVVDTSTPGTPLYFWLYKDDGSNVVETSVPHAAGAFARGVIAGGHTYEIRKLPKIYHCSFLPDTIQTARFDFLDIEWATNAPPSWSACDFRRCFFGANTRIFVLGGNFENCCWTFGNAGFFGGTAASNQGIAGFSQVTAGLMVGTGASNYTIATQGSGIVFSAFVPTTLSKARMGFFNNGYVFGLNVACYDCTGDIVTVNGMARVTVAFIQGARNTQYVVTCNQGGSNVYYLNSTWSADTVSSLPNPFRVAVGGALTPAPFATVQGPNGKLINSDNFSGISAF